MVGLGPAGPDLLTAATISAIERVPVRFVRTLRHPAAAAVGDARAFDSVYEAEPTFDAVYARIVEELVSAAGPAGEVLYAVPGSPLVAERSVELLVADGRVEVEVLPALSFTDLAWARLGVDPVQAGVRLVDGRRFAVEAAGDRGPMLVAQCDSRAVLSDIKLSVEGGPDVVVLQRLGCADESVRTVAWDDLDREVEPDHLTCLYLAELAEPVGVELARFVELVRTLRQRCPWDREQTHASLTRHLLEEAYELLEAIDHLDSAGDDPGPWEHLAEELGDLLFQVVFHATLASEAGRFTLADVAAGVHDKLVGRHPHVFGDVTAVTAGDVAATWEQNKMAEKGRSSLMEGIPGHLPALLFAHKVVRKAASAGFSLETVVALDDHDRSGPGGEAGEVLGARLFRLVVEARRAGLDPEASLRSTTARFRDRFVAVEARAAARGLDLGELDAGTVRSLWEEAATDRAVGSDDD